MEVKTASGVSGFPNLVFPRKARDCWQENLASVAGGSPSKENSPLASNFSAVEESKDPYLSDPYDKPVEISPPKTLREARLSPWWPQYLAACKIEYDGHVQNGTWVLVPLSEVPPGKNILRGKWVFDDKRGEDGRVLKFKARFVAMGFTQKYGVDYQETFAGVVIGKSFRIMLAILNEDPTHEMDHWDVKMAFTQAPVDELLFMYPPEGVADPTTFGKVCKLQKSLYGLKQSAKNWQDLTRDIFREQIFFSLLSDPCVYFCRKDEAWCVASTHVDDIFVLYNKPGKALRDLLFLNFKKYVEIQNLGPISWALNTLILRDRQAGVIKISQEAYVTELLQRHAPQLRSSTSHQKTPGGDYTPISEDSASDVTDESLKKNFQSQIGGLWWLTGISRPDIYYAVHRCSKLQNRPNKKLGAHLQKIFSYLAGTISLGIIFKRSTDATPLLSGYVDAAFATEEAASSRIGYFYLFQGNLVSWTSENTSRVMTSSTEVECRGHRQFHKELNLFTLDGPTIVFEDNTAAIGLSKDPGTPHKRSKHFGIEWAFFKQSVERQEIHPVYVPTDDQLADMLTKSLPPQKFIKLRDLIMGEATLQYHFKREKLLAMKFDVKDNVVGYDPVVLGSKMF
jgi:hypothetical protein